MSRYCGIEAGRDFTPEHQAGSALHVIALAHLNSLLEIIGDWNPIVLREEERFFEKNATDLGVFSGKNRLSTIFGNSQTNPVEGRCSVCFAECLPGEADRELKKLRKEAAANDEVSGRVKLKEEWFAPFQDFEVGLG